MPREDGRALERYECGSARQRTTSDARHKPPGPALQVSRYLCTSSPQGLCSVRAFLCKGFHILGPGLPPCTEVPHSVLRPGNSELIATHLARPPRRGKNLPPPPRRPPEPGPAPLRRCPRVHRRHAPGHSRVALPAPLAAAVHRTTNSTLWARAWWPNSPSASTFNA